MIASTLDQHAAWTNTLRTVASIVIHNHGLLEPVDLTWTYGPHVAGWSWLDRAGVRHIALAHMVMWADIESTLWHEIAHHVAGHIETPAPPDDDTISRDIHPTVALQRLIDSDHQSPAVGFLASLKEQEDQAEAIGAQLKAEFEAEYGPLLALLIGQKC